MAELSVEREATRYRWATDPGKRVFGTVLRWLIGTALLGSLITLLVTGIVGPLGRQDLAASSFLVAAIFAAGEAIVWYRRQISRLDLLPGDRGMLIITMTSGESIELSTASISAIVGIGGMAPMGGAELLWKKTLVVTEHRRFSIALDPKANRQLFDQLLEMSPFAWGFPFGGAVEPPQEVADRTHANAPTKALARLKNQLIVIKWRMSVVGTATILALVIFVVVLLATGRGQLLRSLFWFFVFGVAGFANLRTAWQIGRQIQLLNDVQQRLMQSA